eukprot:gene5057-6969_t
MVADQSSAAPSFFQAAVAPIPIKAGCHPADSLLAKCNSTDTVTIIIIITNNCDGSIDVHNIECLEGIIASFQQRLFQTA